MVLCAVRHTGSPVSTAGQRSWMACTEEVAGEPRGCSCVSKGCARGVRGAGDLHHAHRALLLLHRRGLGLCVCKLCGISGCIVPAPPQDLASGRGPCLLLGVVHIMPRSVVRLIH